MKTYYEKFFEKKLKQVSERKKILDVGGGSPFQKQLKKYEPWFANCDYETLDISPHYKPTIVGDIHKMPIKKNTYDAVLCIAVLEHVDNPHKAVDEIWRILKPGGIGLFYVPSIYPYHAKKGPGGYPDNYRYFEDGIKFLTKGFKKGEIVSAGGYFETLTYFLPYNSKIKFITKPIAYFLDKILKTRNRSVTRGYYFFVEK